MSVEKWYGLSKGLFLSLAGLDQRSAGFGVRLGRRGRPSQPKPAHMGEQV